MYPYPYASRVSPARVGILLAAAPILLLAAYVSVQIAPMLLREILAVVVPVVIGGIVGS